MAAATQPRELPLLITTEMCSGGTYIVTGANVGLGLEAARHLVALGAAKVIMGVRNVAAGETARADIEATTGKSNIAEVWEIDLASYSSVKAFAKKAIAELDRVDALIENAAVAAPSTMRAEGHALVLTVNVISTFLLGVMMLPKLSESAKRFGILPHIAIVTSEVSFEFEADWNAIKEDPIGNMDSGETLGLKAYPLSKLLEIFAVRHLASLIPVTSTGVVVNLVCPGLCKTSLSRNAPPAFRQSLAEQHEKIGRTAEVGSRTLLHGAVAGKESHGCLLSNCKIFEEKVPSWVTDDDGKRHQKLVWESITKELETIEPGCVKKLY